MSRSGSPIPEGPRPIHRLEEALVNRIAAGEIIHRPASALKELLENALDARSSQIRVTIKDGGLKLLQIVDNGSGIHKSDLPILCERFTTSKLTEFSDLQSLATYGFRGEALASISHVAHLTITTKTKTDTCAWKAFYADGSLASLKPGGSAEPKPCAGNNGTTITVEDLFYNTTTRLSALRSSSDEYARILDVITRYAVHNPTVSFTCKKEGTRGPDVSTPSGSTTQANIKLLYGAAIEKEILHVTVSSEDTGKQTTVHKGKSKARDDVPDWKAEAYVTNVNYHAKKITLLLFINHRLVESSKVKRAIEAVYSAILPKGSSPFVYLSIQIAPNQVDVNVHPTKREVHFMNEEEIINDIADAVQQKVALQGESRTFEYQTLLTGGVISVGAGPSGVPSIKDAGKNKRKIQDDDDVEMMDCEAETEETSASVLAPKKALPQHKIRTSMMDQTLDSMFAINDPSKVLSSEDAPGARKREDIPESQCILSSIKDMRNDVLKKKHGGLADILTNHIFVGIVDMGLEISLVQHLTKLYMLNHGVLSEELFYQLGLRQFGNFGRLKLHPPPPIRSLIQLAVDADADQVVASGLEPGSVVETIVNILTTRSEMLEEYFSMRINRKGELETLPVLLKDYTPNLDRLPELLMRLGPEVDWSAEGPCFDTFLRELAYFYRPSPVDCRRPSPDSESVVMALSAEDKSSRWQVQHVVFPAIRKYLVPHKGLLEGDNAVQVANLPDLYRVFERC
ncbi:DNA mismatch repair protein [Tulasnella sp. JGI-2019a]|nr:DNA mismatch repair protein [Tulasnella sp. JGI-2019a]